ncbi:unnamed protein product [Diplocarpon coronariae]
MLGQSTDLTRKQPTGRHSRPPPPSPSKSNTKCVVLPPIKLDEISSFQKSGGNPLGITRSRGPAGVFSRLQPGHFKV